MNKQNKNNIFGKSIIEGKLIFYDLRENIINKVVGKTTEKNKGVAMVELIMNRFGLSDDDIINMNKNISEINKEMVNKVNNKISIDRSRVNWTRDDRGNIISPFRSNKKPKSIKAFI